MKTNGTKRFRLLLAGISGFVLSGSVYTWAGSKLSEPVNTGGAGSAYITGALGSARNTTNTIEYIGCLSTYYFGSPEVVCEWKANPSNQAYFMRSVWNGPFFAFVGASGDSKFGFESYNVPQPNVDAQMSFIEVYNDSRYRPK